MADAKEQLIGKVTHYYSKIGVAILELSADVAVGDQLHFKGKSTDFQEGVSSMQVERAEVSKASKGGTVGIKVSQSVRDGDEVYRV